MSLRMAQRSKSQSGEHVDPIQNTKSPRAQCHQEAGHTSAAAAATAMKGEHALARQPCGTQLNNSRAAQRSKSAGLSPADACMEQRVRLSTSASAHQGMQWGDLLRRLALPVPHLSPKLEDDSDRLQAYAKAANRYAPIGIWGWGTGKVWGLIFGFLFGGVIRPTEHHAAPSAPPSNFNWPDILLLPILRAGASLTSQAGGVARPSAAQGGRRRATVGSKL